MLYGTSVWDPWLIVLQIIALQLAFYSLLGVLSIIFLRGFVEDLSIDVIFDARHVTVKNYQGMMAALAVLVSGGLLGPCLFLVVERAKKVLDFSSTVYLVHLLASSLLSHFPANPFWWVVNLAAFVAASQLGEMLCAHREM